MVYIYCNTSGRETFSFTFSVGPALKFSFDRPVPVATTRPFKRRRALSDVDGDGNEGRKKRRLRLHLITSRLSRPFSQPASNCNIVKPRRIAVWGKHKALGRNLIRKAAIMNRVRLMATGFMRQQEQRSRETLALREIVVQTSKPLPPSPLGLSNYDALDLEGMDDDDEEVLEGGVKQTSMIYSDFNILNPCTSNGEGDENEYLDALDGITPEDLPDAPPAAPSDDSIVEMLREKERQGDSYFVRMGG